jgi:hypothetical protein
MVTEFGRPKTVCKVYGMGKTKLMMKGTREHEN